MADLAKGGLELKTEGALKRMPKDFEHVNEPDLAAAMKLKHFYVHEDIDPKIITTPKLVDLSVDFVKRAMPLLTWGKAV